MNQHYTTATVFGGTGFLGRQVVRELAKRGIVVKVASRVPERAYFLRTCGTVGQIVPFACNYTDAQSIDRAVQGSDYVVNCIGILFEKGKRRTFKKAHVEIPSMIAESAARHSVKSFVHISALGIEEAKSNYAKTKLEGEQAVLEKFPKATILRPSVMFGEDDHFFNMFARMARVFPVLPLIGGGKTKFQPVYAGDVADAVMTALGLSEKSIDAQGKIFELGGPEIVTFRQIYERLFQHTHRRRTLISLPFGIAKIQGCVMSLLPNPPLTKDQVESLKTDSIVAGGALTYRDLGIEPTAMDLVLPAYLETYRPGGRFADQKNA
jgi:uncharacterized protein YbjT (DUF2867 family)